PLLQVAALLLLAGAAAVAFTLTGERVEGRPARRATLLVLAGLRGAAVAVVVALLLNPIVTRARQDAGKPTLLVLLDTSRSMAVPDVEGRPRFEAAKRALLDDGRLLADYASRYRPVYF